MHIFNNNKHAKSPVMLLKVQAKSSQLKYYTIPHKVCCENI